MVNWKPALLPVAFLLIIIFAFSYEDNPILIPDWSEFSEPKNEEIYFPALNPEDNVNTQKIAYFGEYTPVNLVVDGNTLYPLNSRLTGTKLTWVDIIDDESGYEIHRSTNNVDFSLIKTLAANTTSYEDLNILDTLYYYKVLAVHDPADTGDGLPHVGITLNRSHPGTPILTLNAQNNSLDRIDLNWNYVDYNSYRNPLLNNGGYNYWRFDENSTQFSLIDENGAFPTYGGTAVPGKFKNARNYISGVSTSPAGDSAAIGNSSFSFSTWVKTSAGGVMFGYYDGGSPGILNWVGMYGAGNGTAYMWLRSAQGYPTHTDNRFINGGPNLLDNKWHHVVGVRSRNVGMYLYVDGVLVASGADVTDTLVCCTSYIAYDFTGSLDDVMLINRAITAADVNKMYNHGSIKYGINRSVGSTGTFAPVNGTLQEFTAADGTDITSFSGWTKFDGNGSTFTIAGNKLRMFYPGSALIPTTDYARYTFPAPITNNAIVEFDLNIPNQSSWDFSFLVSNSTVISITNSAVYTRIDDENLYMWDSYGSKWLKKLDVGGQYHFKYVLDNTNKMNKAYLNDIQLLDINFADITTNGFRYLTFANMASPTTDTTWYVDNFKVTPLYDVNTFADNNSGKGLDANPPATPGAPTTSNITISSMDVSWTPPADAGTDYNYHVTAFDYFGNDSNVVKNGGMEGDYVNGIAPYWTPIVLGATASRSTSNNYSGYASQKLTIPNEGFENKIYQNIGPITNGNRYLLQFAVKVTSGKLDHVELRADGTYGTQVIPGAINITDSSWTIKSYYFQATGTTAPSVNLIFTNPTNTPGTWEIDDVKLIPVKSATITSGIKNYFVNCVSGGTCAAGNDANDKWVAVGAGFPTFTGLSALTQYCFTVIAQDYGDNNSSASSQGCGTTTGNAPILLNADYNSTYTLNSVLGGVSLRWSNPASETSFKIFRSTNNSVFTQIATPTQNVTSYDDLGLTSNTTYYYKVAGVYGGGDANSSVASVITLDRSKPLVPVLTLTPQSASNRIDTSWSQVDDNSSLFTIGPKVSPSHLKLHWNFDEGSGTTVYDLSGNDLNGTLSNVDWNAASAKKGSSITFDANAERITMLNDSSLKDFTAGSISFWVSPRNTNGGTGYHYVFHYTDGGDASGGGSVTDYIQIGYNVTTNQYVVFMDDADVGVIDIRSTTAPTYYGWDYIVVTQDGGTSRLYVNGILQSDTDSGEWFNHIISDSGNFGTIAISGRTSWSTSYFNGNIDKLKIYDVQLTTEQVNELYRKDSIVSYWRFEEGSGTIANDVQGSYNMDYVASPPIVSGKLGNARSFNGSTQWATTTGNTAISTNYGTKSISASAWIKTTSTNNQGAFGYFGGSSGEYFSLGSNGGSADFYIEDQAGVGIGVNAGVINDNQWHHITGVRDYQNKIYLYVDGVQAGTPVNDTIGNISDPTPVQTFIGTLTASPFRPFTGSIDEVMFFDKALSASDVNKLYYASIRKYGLNKSATQTGTYTPLGGTLQEFTAADATDITSVSGWTKVDGNGSTYTIAENKLRMFHPGSAPSLAYDYARYTLSTTITNNAIVEFDVNIANSDNYDFLFVAGDSSHSITGPYSVYMSINNEQLLVLDGGALRDNLMTLTVGQTYHFKIVFDQKLTTARVYVDDKLMGEFVYPYPTTTGLQKISFVNDGFSTVNTTWYVDNLKVTPLIDGNSYNDTSAVDANSPSVPTNASVNGATSSTLNVDWNASTDNGNTYYYDLNAFDNSGNTSKSTVSNATITTGLKQYFVNCVSGGTCVAGSDALDKVLSGTSTTISGLTSGVQYCFTVLATDNVDNNSSATSQQCGTTTANSAPTLSVDANLTYARNSDLGGMSLSWNDQSGETSYKVFRSSDNNVFTQIATPAANAVSYSNIDLNDNTSYYFKVAAVYGDGDANSNVATAFTPDRTSPTHSSDLAGTYVLDQINLTWSKASDNNSSQANIDYNVMRSTTAIDTNASYSTLLKLDDASSYSNTTANDNANPNAPSISSVTADSATQLTVNWSAVLDTNTAYYYKLNIVDLQQNDVNSNSITTIAHSGISKYWVTNVTTSVTDGNTAATAFVKGSLDVNANYCFTVKAMDRGDNNSSSSAQSCKFTLANVPSAPTVFNAASTTIDVNINVNSNPAATQFAIYDQNTSKYVQSNGSEDTTAVWQTNAQWGTKTVTGLSASSQHCFQVKARNGNLTETALSAQACGSTSGSAVNDLVATPQTKAKNSVLAGIDLSWSDVAGETNYTLYRSTNGTVYTTVGTVAQNATSYADNTLSDNTLYYYILQSNYGGSDLNSNIPTAFTPDRTAPTHSSNLAGTYVLDQINLTWSKASDNNSSQANIDYNVMRSTTAVDSNVSYSTLLKLDDAASYSDTTANDNANPSAPTISSVNADSATQLTVNWSSVLDANTTYYYKLNIVDLLQNDVNSNSITTVALSGISKYWVTNVNTSAVDLNTSATARVVGSLDVNANYCFTVKAMDRGDNNSSASAQSCKFTLANVPSAPTVNNATVTTLDVAINVNSNPAATQFAIYDQNTSKYVQANGAEDTSAIWQTNAQWGTKTITGLTSGSQHCFQVKARNGDNTATALSAQTCLTTIALSAPTNLALTFVNTYDLNSSKGDVNLTWTDNSPGEDGYKVYRSLDNSIFNSIASIAANSQNYFDNNSTSGLKDYTTYYYKASAYSGSSDSNSSVVSITLPDRTAPNIPDENSVQELSPLSLTFTWFVTADNNTSANITYTAKCVSGTGCTDLNSNIPLAVQQTTNDLNISFPASYGLQYCFQVKASDDINNTSANSSPNVCYTTGQTCSQLSGNICLGVAHGYTCNGSVINDAVDVPAGTCYSLPPTVLTICNNTIDNDADGLIDDCFCGEYYNQNVLPSQKQSLDLVFLIDRSASMVKPWETVCSTISDINSSLNAKGIDPLITVYGIGDLDGGGSNSNSNVYRFCKPGDTRSGCKKAVTVSCMNAYTSTPTISGFTLGDNSNPDATSEAWGLGSIWVSKNNPWRSNSGTGGGIRAQIIIGDHDPTGGQDKAGLFASTWRGTPGNSAYDSSTEQNMVDSMITAADGNSVVLFGMYSLTELKSKILYKASDKYDVVELFEEFATRGNGESQLYGADKNATIGKISNFVTQLSATKKVNCAATGGTITRLTGEDLCTGPETCTCPAGKDMNATGHCVTIVCTPSSTRTCGTAAGLSGAVCGTGTQTCNGSGTNWSSCSAVETQSCTPSSGGNGTRACLLGQWGSCDAYSTFFVGTAVKDVNGFFNPQNPAQWIPQWTNTNVNAKLICGGGLEASSQIGFGPGTSGSNYFAFGSSISSPTATGTDKNVTYSPGITYTTGTFSDLVFKLDNASLFGYVNIVIQGQDINTNWTHYSAQLEPFNFNPNYVSAFVRYRTASTRAGLSSASWSNFTPPSSEMQSVTGKWIQFNVKLSRNTTYTTTTDPIALRGFFTEYVKNGSNPNTACLNTYYRVDTNSTALESFVPTTAETGSIVRDGQNWRLLNATDKNILFSQDGNYAIKFFSRSLSNNDESVRQINVLVKKFPDTINLSQICSGIKDGLNFDINFSAITTTEGAYKYRLYASTNPNFEYRKLLLESTSATTHSVNVANIGLSSCGDNVCSAAENCPADSLGCNFGQICSNGCQVQTSITFNAGATTCNPGMNKPSLDSYCQTLFGVGFACIDGCVPITTNQFSQPVWSRTTSNTDSSYCGDGYCSASEFCPKDSAYCGNGRTCSYGCQNSQSVCGDNTCSQFENCSTEDSICGSGFACINGCVPTSANTAPQTSFSPQYKFTGSSTPENPTRCGDGYCSASEFCPFDNRYCTGIAGITEGICVNGCVNPYNTAAVQAFTTLTCGDNICGIGENCPLDNNPCGSGSACISGCLPATGTIISNPTATRFSANKGSYDGTLWFQLEVESVTGSLSRSPPVSCQIDYESPFQIPTDGRGVVKNIQSGWGDLNLNFPTSAFGADNNVVIDANTSAPTFARGTMHQAYNFDVPDGNYSFTNKPRLTLDINVSTLNCYNAGGSAPLYGCTASDLNKVSIYRYNTTTGDWDKLSSIVNVSTLEVYADLNSFSTYGQGEDTNAPTVTLSSPSNASTTTNTTPSFTASSSEEVSNCYLQLATNSNFSPGQIVTGYSAIDVGSDCDYDAPSALSNDTYYWRMKATDIAGNAGNYTSAFSFTINSTTPGGGGGNNAVCGNNSCESGENQNNCPADCGTQGVCTNGEIRDCGTCGSQTCSNELWETCDEPISCGNADLIISAVAADAKVIYQTSANIVANIQNNGEAIGQSFQIGIQESQGAYSDSKAISSLGANDATAVLFNIPWSESYAGQTKSFVMTADSTNVISELNESNNQRTVSIQFGSIEQCGNLVDDDYDGLIDDGCGLPNLKITNITVGTPKFVDSELVRVDFNVTIETEFEDVDTEFAVAYFKDALQTSNRVTIELIDSIEIGQQVKLLFVYTAPIGEVFRFDAPQNHDNFVEKALFAGLTNFYVEVDSGDSIGEVNEADNLLILNIQNLVPDLTITDFTIPASSVSGTQFEIIATIFNQGNFAAEAGTYSVSVYSDGIVKATVPGELAEKNGQWIATIIVPELSEGIHTITITVDSLEELVESNETNNSVSGAHDVIDSLDELYSYSTFTDREPIIVGVWNPLSLNYTHSFKIPSVTFQTESLKLNGLNDQAVFEIYFLGNGISVKNNYQLQAERNGTQFNSKSFKVITSTRPNVINLVNDTTISWSLNPRFLKLMDYQRLNELTFVWWKLFSEQ